jgi:hypothetical protein
VESLTWVSFVALVAAALVASEAQGLQLGEADLVAVSGSALRRKK